MFRRLPSCHLSGPSKIRAHRCGVQAGLVPRLEVLEDRTLPAVSFAPPVGLLNGALGASGLVAADFNGDGKPDLAVAQLGNVVSVLLSNANGTFGPAAALHTGSSSGGLAVADFNRDGKPDLAVTDSQDNTVSVLLGNGDGTFRPALTGPAGSAPEVVVAGDFNGDGKPDLVVEEDVKFIPAPVTGQLSFLPGNGDGTFGPAVGFGGVTNSAVPLIPASLAAGDLNGDDKPDLVAGHAGFGNLGPTAGSARVFFSNGNGTFTAGPVLDQLAPSGAVALGDFNGDGSPDVAFGRSTIAPGPGVAAVPAGVTVYLGDGKGGFGSPVLSPVQAFVPASANLADLVAADFDGDGRPDLIAADSKGPLQVFLGNGDGSFRPDAQFTNLLGLQRLSPGDLNGDGDPDLIFMTSSFGSPGGGNSVGVLINRPLSPGRAFVTQVHQDVFGFDPDPATLDFIGGLLDQGQVTRLQVVQQVQAEIQYSGQLVGKLYDKILSRLVTGPEDEFWFAFLHQGGTPRQLEALLLASQEFLGNLAGGDINSFLVTAYQRVLGRAITPAETSFWVQSFQHGTSLLSFANQLLNSQEAATNDLQSLAEQFLHRPADGGLIAFFVPALQQGVTDEQVAQLLAGSQEYFAAAAGGADHRFVARIYHDLLGRPAGAADFGFWAGLLNQGKLSPTQFVQQVEASGEYRTALVQGLYQTLLHRAADPQGLAFFTSALAAGATAEQVQALLAGSSEYFQQRGGGTAAGFLEALFQDALQRPPDAAGKATFTQALMNGASPADVAAVIFGSDEYHRVLVGQLYQALLHRPVDAAGSDFWLAAFRQGLRDEQVRAAIANTAEYFALG